MRFPRLHRFIGAIRELRSSSLANPSKWMIDWFRGGSRSSSGIDVTADTAMQSTAVLCAVRVIAETLSTLPCVLYQRTGTRGRERAERHPLYPVLHDQPNEWQTSVEWFEMMQGHLCLRGNAYALPIVTPRGTVEQLIPLHPDRVYVLVGSGAARRRQIVGYEYQPLDGPPATYLPSEVMHIRGISSDGITGLSPIDLAAEAVGLSLAAEGYGARFFANDARPGGVLEYSKVLTPEQIVRLKATWEAPHTGSNAHRIAVLEDGMKWAQMGMTSEAAQFLESRKFQVNEIARMFRVPPHLLYYLERATFSNIEQQGIDFVQHTMRPWCVRWEKALARDLLTDRDRQDHIVKFVLDALLRGDTQTRYAGYAIGRQWGFLSVNDIRELEDWNPLPNGDGDVYLVPVNMTPADQIGIPQPAPALSAPKKAPALPATAGPDGSATSPRSAVMPALGPLFADAIGRVLRREVQDARRALAKAQHLRSTQPVEQWMAGFYPEHEEFVARTLEPIYRAGLSIIEPGLVDAGYDGAEPARAAARRYVTESREQLRVLMKQTPPELLAGALEAQFSEWERTRAHTFIPAPQPALVAA